MAKNQRRLEANTLRDPNFARFVGKLADDTEIHSCEEFQARVGECMMKMQRELANCPYFKRAVKILMRLHHMVEETKEVSDLGTEKEWASWWNKNKFENPFEDMDWKMMI